MFERWSEFFLLLGGASGALIGLLFVVTALAATTRLGPEDLARGQALYMTPTLFNFTTVLLLSAAGTVPGIGDQPMAIIVGLWALTGIGYSASVAYFIRKRRLPDAGRWSDVWTYGLLPTLTYLAMLATAWSAWQSQSNAPYSFAVALASLIIVAIRNAWDLVVFIAPRADNT